ncbi:asparaginase domain-containing protein [Chromobacterium haemolyticum]|nr:asparaginase domain-containing protein [Chromobacterium haemolyticum]
MLAFALRGLAKPVVLTGAQLPLLHPRSDGWNNVADALEAASQPELHEVAIAFDRLLLRGSRARKLDVEHFAGFGSPNAEPLARFAIHPHWNKAAWLPGEGEFQPKALREDLSIACLFLSPGQGAALAGRADGGPCLGRRGADELRQRQRAGRSGAIEWREGLDRAGAARCSTSRRRRGARWKWALTPPVSRWRAPARWRGRT